MANVRKAEREKGKTVRVPFGGPRLKLQLSNEDEKEFKKKGYVLRWFNEQDGRIERALAGGYQFVTHDEAPSLGGGAIHQDNTDVGAKVSKVVSRGEPIIRAYLMKILKKYYDEDQQAKQNVNDKVDEALKAGHAGGASIENQYGPGVTYTK